MTKVTKLRPGLVTTTRARSIFPMDSSVVSANILLQGQVSSRRRGAATIQVQVVHALGCRPRACRRPIFCCTLGEPNPCAGELGEELGQRANSGRAEGRGVTRERNTAPIGSHYDRRQASSHSH